MTSPKRGEIWRANLEPVRGAELTKTRPVVIISVDDVGRLPIKLVAPVTAWSASKENHVWLVRVRPTTQNGLTKESCVDTLQVRGLATSRFDGRVGRLSADDLDEVIASVALVVGYQPE